jgi:hypothetical protein
MRSRQAPSGRKTSSHPPTSSPALTRCCPTGFRRYAHTSVFSNHSHHVLLSGAETSRSEVPAESKDPYTLPMVSATEWPLRSSQARTRQGILPAPPQTSTSPHSVCVRTRCRTTGGEKMPEHRAPEGRSSLAQRFSAGENGRNDSSPGGTTQFSRAHFSALH